MLGTLQHVDPVIDTRARPLRDLRISVTDRCDFRCVYCMPKEVFGRDFQFLRRSELLTFEEVARIAGIASGLGVQKLRLTGGEPLLRRDIERLVAMLAAIDGIDDVAMTTNGSLLARKARALADAGLRRVTVSLDSLDDAVFGAVNDVDFPVERVLAGIDAAAAAGLPVKVNMVVKRGLNDGSRARHGRPLPRHGSRAAADRVHGRRDDERMADGRRRAGGRAHRDDRRRVADRAGRARVPRRGRRAATATATGPARSA